MLQVTREHSDLIGSVTDTLTVFSTAVDGLLLLSRFIPMLKSVAAPVVLLRPQIKATITRLEKRQAANDEFYSRLSKELFDEAA
jgi:hypothetical protein